MPSLPDMLTGVLAIEPDAPALEFRQTWRSWGALDAAARRLEAEFDRLGLGPGARIGVVVRNEAAFVPALIAIFRTGRCLVILNGAAPPDRLAEDIASVRAPVLLIGESLDQTHAALAAALGASGANVYVLRDDETAFHDAVTADAGAETRDYAPDTAIEMLTSGTTGKPKRIPLPSRTLEKALAGAASYEKGRSADAAPQLRSGVQIVTAPLSHIGGITYLMTNLLAGRKVCLLEKFTVEGFRAAVVRHRPKIAGAPPAALRMILDADIPKEDLSSLVAYRTGTAPLDVSLADAFYEKYGIPVLQNYGATEFAGGVAGWTLADFKAHWAQKKGSVGRLNAGIEGRVIAAENGETVLSPGEEGLLELRGANIGDGKTWTRTTDLVVLDTDGFLYVRGRADGAIIRGGFKIMPEDVIKALEAHPAIREAGVVALTDRRLGQVPGAAFRVRAGQTAPSADALKTWLRERLLPYQVPPLIIEVEDFPRTTSLKIDQQALQALLESAAAEGSALEA
ncbi:MAG: acyl--CoA ligase [Hyphomonadaceae bacterium]|nr:acyl--CoA ligase [Hyphomonadaceae bacterium]